MSEIKHKRFLVPAKSRTGREEYVGGNTLIGSSSSDSGAIVGSVTKHTQLNDISIIGGTNYDGQIHLDYDSAVKLLALRNVYIQEGSNIVVDVEIDADGDVTYTIGTEDDYISKTQPDTAKGLITFEEGLTSDLKSTHKKGIQIGESFAEGVTGVGGNIDENANAELKSLKLRDFLEVPEFRFNRVDVISGELWNTIGFGTIKSVDISTQTIELKLEEGELGGLHLNDFCRGLFNSLLHTDSGPDENKFERMPGFFTSYFTPIEILVNEPGAFIFRYALQSESTPHPVPFMKFVAYANPNEIERQRSAYSTRTYTRYLDGVVTWDIKAENITSQFGDLSNLNLFGFNLSGYSSYQKNVYFSGNIQFVESFWEQVRQESPVYSVNLFSPSIVVKDNQTYSDDQLQTDGNTVVVGELELVTSSRVAYSKIECFKNNLPLQHGPLAILGYYTVVATPENCTASVEDGMVYISEVIDPTKRVSVKFTINCEGSAVYTRTFALSSVSDGPQGDTGASIRWSDYLSTEQYYSGWMDGDSSDDNPLRYKDYVTYLSGGQVTVHQCIKKPPIGTLPSNTTYFSPISYMPALATKLLLADDAIISGWIFTGVAQEVQLIASGSAQGEQIILDGINQTISVGSSVILSGYGTTASSVRLGIGAGLIDNKPFRVLQNGAMYASLGKIAGLYMIGDVLTNGTENNDAAVIFNNTQTKVYAAIGGLIPATAGFQAAARFVNNNNDLLNDVNYSLIVGAKDAGGGPEKNHAIAMISGFISGLALKGKIVQSADTSVTIAHEDVHVSCFNSNAATVYLPANPETFKVVEIRALGAVVTIDGNGKSIFTDVSNTSLQIGTGRLAKLFYNGTFWEFNSILW